jgi:hypothetical protein
MNAPLLVTTAICVGVPALAAAALLAWQRHPVIDAPDRDETREYVAVDAEDHGDEPSPGEQAIIDQIRAGSDTFGIVPVITAPVEARITLGEISRVYDLRDRATSATTTAQMRRVMARDAVEAQAPQPVLTPARDDSTLLTADELADEVAAYEAAAAERAQRAGVTWPTNPAAVGICRYGDKAGKA